MFLLRQWELTGEERFLNMVSTTLEKMRQGGIWDHIGFGFHRYSTDREWLLPHFEKMLYDQALLMMAYTECWQADSRPVLKQTVFEIAEYVERDLSHPDGAFFSAEDADSEGEEGKFYVWEKEEVKSILPQEEAEKFVELFNITKEGNFEDEATQKRTGKNIPHLSEELTKSDDSWFGDVRKQLFEMREKRERPLLDDKVLTDWNALMIAAFAKAGFAFGEDNFIKRAEKAFQFLEENLVTKDELMHRYKGGEAGIPAMADDYAFLVWALIELYEATWKPKYLQKALHWNQQFLNLFWDEEKGGFYFSITDEDQVYGRQKKIFDGAIPSSNSVAMVNLIRLSRLTGRTELEDYADRTGRAFSADLIRSGASICQAMQAVQFLNSDSREITLAADEQETAEILQPYRSKFTPFAVHHIIGKKSCKSLNEIAPYTSTQKKKESLPTLYVCKDFSCDAPVNDRAEIIRTLG